MFADDIKAIEARHGEKAIEILPPFCAPHSDHGTEILCTLTIIYLANGKRIVWNSTLECEQ